jgi:hypothetical protein
MIMFLAGAAMFVAPAQANPLNYQQSDVGTFVGARVQLSLGGKARPRPRAAFTVAPTRRIASDRSVQTRIGEGAALSLSPGTGLAFTLAGKPAKSILPLTQGHSAPTGSKAHLSSAGWAAVGIGVAVIAAVGFAMWVDEIEENSD